MYTVSVSAGVWHDSFCLSKNKKIVHNSKRILMNLKFLVK
jgi:hypothetical protein